MSSKQPKDSRYWPRQALRAWRRIKHFSRHFRRSVLSGQKSVLFILGCQRSGTTLATRIFERDWNATVFGEFSELSSDDQLHGIRLNALDKVEATIWAEPYPFVVSKPLVESQYALRILERIAGCKILWLYRSYVDVAASDLAKFGERNGIDNIRGIVHQEPNNWRAEGVSDGVRQVLARYFSEKMKPLDAAALFWYARNSLYFDLNLRDRAKSGRVMLLRYEQLTDDALTTMQAVYAFAGRPFPGARIVAEVDAGSVGKGKKRITDISAEIRDICDLLLNRLDTESEYTQT